MGGTTGGPGDLGGCLEPLLPRRPPSLLSPGAGLWPRLYGEEAGMRQCPHQCRLGTKSWSWGQAGETNRQVGQGSPGGDPKAKGVPALGSARPRFQKESASKWAPYPMGSCTPGWAGARNHSGGARGWRGVLCRPWRAPRATRLQSPLLLRPLCFLEGSSGGKPLPLPSQGGSADTGPLGGASGGQPGSRPLNTSSGTQVGPGGNGAAPTPGPTQGVGRP